MDEMLNRWNQGSEVFISPGFQEWLNFKKGYPSAFPSIADQPYQIAREFDYLLEKYGKTDGNAAQMIHELARAEMLNNEKYKYV